MPTGRELIMLARQQFLRDPILGGSFEDDEFNLWKNAELLEMLNQAVSEACLRARLLVDSTTSDICTLAVTADNPWLSVDSRVHSLERVILSSQTEPLEKKSSAWMDENIRDWESREGLVEYYIWDGDPNRIRLVGIPEDSDTANLTVWRRPLVPMQMNEEPEINEVHHYHLLHWLAHLAFIKPGSQTFNGKQAGTHAAQFSAFFGERPNADTIEQRRRHYPMRSPARFF